MEYEPHFTGEETKAAEGHGLQARCEPTSTDPKTQGPLRAVASVALPPGAPISLLYMRALSPVAQLLAHP